MSSETSTETARLKPGPTDDKGLQPYQFFILAGLGCATAAVFMARGRGSTAVILLTLLIGTAAFVGLMALRAVQPLLSNEDDRAATIGQRTRAALEREKHLTLRAIKELEFDRAMGKLSEQDFKEMAGRLRARAARLIRQLDAGAGYRDQIERDLAKRLEGMNAPSPRASTERVCANCETRNDADAQFCKRCGTALA